ncbi:hypothetical protein [Dokdonella ginsengisoli]|uniref:Uncharacterized protein n=1 Tax=Dokdonella ginsengisoli TaxID=363846 RepID=A0ABV9QUF4_9GAMM
MNGSFVVGLFLASFLASPAAGATDIACEGCSYSRMMSRAQTQGKGTHRIFSYSSGVIYRFSVTCPGNVVEGSGGEFAADSSSSDTDDLGEPATGSTQGACPLDKPLEVAEIPLDSAMADAWPKILAFIQARNANYPGSRYDFEVNSGDNDQNYANDGSVYNVIRDYPARTSLFNDISRFFSPIQQFLAAAGAAARAHFTNFSNTLLIKFSFKDGTSIVMKFDYTTQQFEFVKNSARQPDGLTPIVEANTDEYSGNYGYGGADPRTYEKYLRDSVGITLVGGGGVSTMSCTWNGEKLTCKIPRMNN